MKIEVIGCEDKELGNQNHCKNCAMNGDSSMERLQCHNFRKVEGLTLIEAINGEIIS